jgi:hypothetical protein
LNSIDFAVSHIVGLTKKCKPKKDGLQIAKEILEINPEHRIIFASAYIKETLVESVKELKRVVELYKSPFQCLNW